MCVAEAGKRVRLCIYDWPGVVITQGFSSMHTFQRQERNSRRQKKTLPRTTGLK